MKLFFGMKINIKLPYKMMLSVLVVIDSHAQITKITSLQNPCNISRKKGLMKLIFCLKIRTKLPYKLMLPILVAMISHAQSPEVTSLQNLRNISRKKCVMKLLFVQINIKVLYKLRL